MANDDRSRNLGAHGPERDEIIRQGEAQRNDLPRQSDHQTNAADSRQSATSGTGNAERANDAAGGDEGPNHLGEAERAFELDRGDRSTRERPDGSIGEP